MQGITDEKKEGIWHKIREYQTVSLTEKDREVLTGIMHSEPMLKALGQVLAYANGLPQQMIPLKLISNPADLEKAVQCQGTVIGIVNTIESLLTLITLPEENEDDGTATE